MVAVAAPSYPPAVADTRTSGVWIPSVQATESSTQLGQTLQVVAPLSRAAEGNTWLSWLGEMIWANRRPALGGSLVEIINVIFDAASVNWLTTWAEERESAGIEPTSSFVLQVRVLEFESPLPGARDVVE